MTVHAALLSTWSAETGSAGERRATEGADQMKYRPPDIDMAPN
jgi:hypothetical protein